jgi:hypothetical protein
MAGLGMEELTPAAPDCRVTYKGIIGGIALLMKVKRRATHRLLGPSAVVFRPKPAQLHAVELRDTLIRDDDVGVRGGVERTHDDIA